MGAVPASCPPGTLPCQVHSIRAELRFLDNQQPVPWAECTFSLSIMTVDSGPLFMGALQTKVPAGAYKVIFPDIDAAEWWEG